MDTIRSLQHLRAAYILTWCVHLGYILFMVRGFVQVKREVEEIKKQ